MKTNLITKAAFLSLSVVVILGSTTQAQEEKKVKKAIIKTVEVVNGDSTVVMKTFNPDDPADKKALDELMKKHQQELGESGLLKGHKQVIVTVDDKGQKHITLNGQEVKDGDANTVVVEEEIVMPDGKKGKQVTVKSTTTSGDASGKNMSKEVKEMKFISDDGKEIRVEMPGDANWDKKGGDIKVSVNSNDDGEAQVFVFKSANGEKPIIIRISDAKADKKEAKKSAPAVTDNTLNIEAMKVYPNPNNGKFNLSFNLTEKGTAKVVVTDITGKELFNETLTDFSGEYNRELDLTEKVSGTYLVSVTQNGKRSVKQIVKE